MHGTPTLRIQQIQTYDAVTVDVRVERDFPLGARDLCEDYFGGFYGVGGGEHEAEPVLVGGGVEGVVEDGHVHLPFAEIGGGDEGYAWWEGAVELGRNVVS